MLVENGHSWSSIKQYSLAEIGVFYKTIILKERDEKIDSLRNNWISTHYDQKSFQEVINNLTFKKTTSNIESPKSEAEEIRSEWKRLANFMSKRK